MPPLRTHYFCVISSLLFLTLLAGPASAEFFATGKMEGWFCSGSVIEVCSLKKIDAVMDGDRPYSLPNRFSSVDEYNARQNRCWVQVHTGIVNRLKGDIPVFWQYKGGPRDQKSSYEELGTPESMVFGCTKL